MSSYHVLTVNTVQLLLWARRCFSSAQRPFLPPCRRFSGPLTAVVRTISSQVAAGSPLPDPDPNCNSGILSSAGAVPEDLRSEDQTDHCDLRPRLNSALHHSLVLGNNAASGTVQRVLFFRLCSSPRVAGSVRPKIEYSWVRILLRATVSTNELTQIAGPHNTLTFSCSDRPAQLVGPCMGTLGLVGSIPGGDSNSSVLCAIVSQLCKDRWTNLNRRLLYATNELTFIAYDLQSDHQYLSIAHTRMNRRLIGSQL